MQYENSEKKFVAVVNQSISTPVILNALAHVAYGLAKKQSVQSKPLEYKNCGAGFRSTIDQFPFIILKSRNNNQMKTLVSQVVEMTDINYNVFTTTMIGQSAQSQIEATEKSDPDALEYVVVLLFGEQRSVSAVTKKFSLLKD
jgi:hypothetical protein